MGTVEEEIKKFEVHKRHSESTMTYDSFPNEVYAIKHNNKLFFFYHNIDMTQIDESYKNSVKNVLIFKNGGNTSIEGILGESHPESDSGKYNGNAVGIYIDANMFNLCFMGPYVDLVKNAILNIHN